MSDNTLASCDDFNWSKGGENINPWACTAVVQNTTTGRTDFTSGLKLDSVTAENTGQYKCTFHEIEKTMELVVSSIGIYSTGAWLPDLQGSQIDSF